MGGEAAIAANPGLRYGAVFLFLAVWMACGSLLHLEANAYLVLGVPLTVLFQRFVRRRPIRALWVQEAPPWRLGRRGVVVAALLSIVPLATLVGSAIEIDLVGSLFALCSLAGAVGAGYALRHFRREQVRPLIWCLLATLALDALQWSLFLGFGVVEIKPAESGVLGHLGLGLFSLLQYIPVVFVMEEVTFRMLDSHLHEADRRRGILSAVLISVAWGLWHLPIGDELSWSTVGLLLYVHVPYGICLSLFWRKTGNLLIPGFAHALGDSIRDALMAGL